MSFYSRQQFNMANKGKWKISLADVPNSVPVHQYIFEKTDFLVQTKKFKNCFPQNYLKTNIQFDIFQLSKDISHGIDLYGSYPFNYFNKKRDDSYLSTSLNYNSQSIDKVSNNPHQGTLGSTIGSHKSTDGYINNQLGKNTYNDTLSFVEKTPLAKYESIDAFLNGLKRTMIRSRISILMGENKSTQDISYGWHNDELIFLNLRVNIPIQSTDNYFIQILNNPHLEQADISEFNLEVGNAYAYDTYKYHRACSKKIEVKPRINLILGVSPWFDYNHDTKEWISNEFYGELHPFEMLEQKHVSHFIGNK